MKSSVFFREGDLAKNIFVENGKLKVHLILEHFIQTYHQIYGPLVEKFKEKDGSMHLRYRKWGLFED